jgi:hypothetical protein
MFIIFLIYGGTVKSKNGLSQILMKKEFVLKMINKFIIHPINEGIFGFSIFLTIIFVRGYIYYLMGYKANYMIRSSDIIFSSVGFICLFLVDILSNYKKD